MLRDPHKPQFVDVPPFSRVETKKTARAPVKGKHMNKKFVKIVAIVLAVLMAVSVAAVGFSVFMH